MNLVPIFSDMSGDHLADNDVLLTPMLSSCSIKIFAQQSTTVIKCLFLFIWERYRGSALYYSQLSAPYTIAIALMLRSSSLLLVRNTVMLNNTYWRLEP